MNKLFFPLVMALAAGCSAPDDTADVTVSAQVSGLSIDDIALVHVTVSGPGMTDLATDLVRVGNTYRGTLGGIPVGDDRVFTADASDAASVVLYHAASSPVTISAGNTALVSLQLTSTTPPEPFDNHAPVIDALFLSAQTVAPGETIDLRVLAHDDDGDSLVSLWSASDGALSSTTGATTTWFAPAVEGHYQIVFQITDPDGSYDLVTAGVDVAASAGRGSAALTATLNTAPRIVAIQGSRLLAATPVPVSVTALDADGDALAYAWSTDCGAEVFAPGTSGTLVVPADTVATACTIHIEVTDARGLTNVGDLVVAVGPEPTSNFDPVIDTTFQSVDAVDHEGEVVLRVTAHDPEAAPLTFAWRSDAGTFLPALDTAGASQVTWVAPGCFVATATISVDVLDGATGRTTSHSFTVSPTSLDCPISHRISSWSADNDLDDPIGGRGFTGTIAYAPGHRNAGFDFDASTVLELTAPSVGLPAGHEERTVELWARVDSMPGDEAVFFGYGAFGQLDGFYALGMSNGRLFFSQWGDAIFGGTFLAGSGYHHIAVTSVGYLASLFLDGELVAQGNLAIETRVGPGFEIRVGYLDELRRLDGGIDEIRIYDRALSAADINRIYRGVTP